MLTETKSSLGNGTNQLTIKGNKEDGPPGPWDIDTAFRKMVDSTSNQGVRITLDLEYRFNMVHRENPAFKRMRSALALFVHHCVNVVRLEGKVPNLVAINEMLSYMDRYEMLRLFGDGEVKPISHINLTINLEKRWGVKGNGKNAIPRIDYILSYGRRIRMGGSYANPNLGRHSILTHIGCNYRDLYGEVALSELDFIQSLFTYLDTGNEPQHVEQPQDAGLQGSSSGAGENGLDSIQHSGVSQAVPGSDQQPGLPAQH